VARTRGSDSIITTGSIITNSAIVRGALWSRNAAVAASPGGVEAIPRAGERSVLGFETLRITTKPHQGASMKSTIKRRLALIGAVTTLATLGATSAHAAWSGSNNVTAGWYNNFTYGGCRFYGQNDAVTAKTNWTLMVQGDCIGLRVRYEFTSQANGGARIWTAYKYAPDANTGIVSLTKNSNETMKTSGHSGRI
jgi:hypothetical protein